MAGITIPLGALLARVERIRPRWLEAELRHSVIAFGGGILLAAVSLVLVPRGVEAVPAWVVLPAVGLGGVVFMAIDRQIARSGGSMSQLVAMIADFLPEAVALGAMFATGEPGAVLLAVLIALQNLPEGFNAYREVMARGEVSAGWVFRLFALLALIGPAAAWIGLVWLADRPELTGVVMLFAAGGILYLTFQDIAPQARLQRHWAPSLGAVLGFMLGLAGQLLLV